MLWEIWKKAISKKGPEAYENFFNSLKVRNNAESKVSSKPYILYLDPVGYCNLHCPFCPTGDDSLMRDKKKLQLATFKHVIDHLGPYLFKVFLYNWGEPLLNKDLPEMIRYVKKYHVVTEISTNLSFPLSEEYAEEFVSSGLDIMLCSVDGSQETYEKYRVGGDYELTMKNIGLLNTIRKKKNLKTPFLIWRFLVFRHNQHEMDIARKKAKELDVEIRFLKPFVPLRKPEWVSTIPRFSSYKIDRQTNERVNFELAKTITVSNKEKHTEQVLNPSKNEVVKTVTVPNQENNEENRQSDRKTKFSDIKKNIPKPCTWLWSAIVINANGSVSPCCAIENQQNDFGNLEDTFETVWNNQNYQSARAIFRGIENKGNTICHTCPVPHIQQDMREYDEEIITYLLGKSSSSEKDQIVSRLKNLDEELYIKALEISKR